ncbi:MAG: UvrB/UvrC motif-containing protein [Bacillota bacterium]
MLCQNCQERPATVHLTKILNYDKVEMHLCEVCAKNVGNELGIFFEPSFNFQNFIAGLLEGDLNLYQQPDTNTEIHCHNCGLTFSDFMNSGLLGCGDCYRDFQNGLEPLLNKIHGSSRHTGKVPKRTGGKFRVQKEITDLRSQLQQAIGREDYEKAAFLRDEIRRLEREL